MLSRLPIPTLKISHRLIVGFAAIVILLAVSVGITVRELGTVIQDIERVDGLRVPTASASSNITKDIYASLAALRGWMLTGNTNFKTERRAIWKSIAEVRAKMDALSEKWTVPANKLRWEEFKTILAEFEAAQMKVETIANSPDEHPATKMLVEQAAPRAAAMLKSITKIIDSEVQGSTDSTRPGNRVQLLGMMADVRGTLGIGLANIRAYLLTGEQKFADNFEKLWRKNDRRFADLKANVALLSPAQRKAFDAFAAKRAEFSALPPKMFEIRGSKKWNMANFTLVSEAAPRAGKLLTILLGAKNEDGSRTGGMQTNQARLLANDTRAADTTIHDLNNLLWLILGVGVLAGVAIAFLTQRSIVPPVVKMTSIMKLLAGGELETNVPAQDRKDEIGDMAGAVQVFKENALRARQLEAEQDAMKKKAEEERRRSMLEVADSFEASVGEIIQTVTGASSELTSTAQSMSSISEETSSQAGSVASSAEETTSNVQAAAAAAEEMSQSVAEINQRVVEASQFSQEAVSEVEKTTSEMSALADAAEKINQVIAMISDIADQTNLLALNATIESARAGEAGKGFAVVASEVKELAGQTTNATDEITRQIGDIQSATERALTSMESVSNVVRSVDEISTSIAAAMEEQQSATLEISRNVQEAAAGTQEVTQNITSVSQASQETGAASEQVTSSAMELSQQSEFLHTEVSSFLEGLRQGPANRREGRDPNYKGPERRDTESDESSAA